MLGFSFVFLCLLNLMQYRSYKATLRTSRVIHPKVSFFQVKLGAGWIMSHAGYTTFGSYYTVYYDKPRLKQQNLNNV